MSRAGGTGAAAALLALALVACGSSGTTHTTAPATGPTATATSTSTATTDAHSSSLTATSAAPGTSTSTSSAPAAGGTLRRRGKPHSQPAPVHDTTRLPATFTVLAGGALRPATVSAPAHTAIALSLNSAGGSYVVMLATPHRQSYSVSGDHPVHVLLRGLANGSYTIKVDGRSRGQLVVGVAPGP